MSGIRRCEAFGCHERVAWIVTTGWHSYGSCRPHLELVIASATREDFATVRRVRVVRRN